METIQHHLVQTQAEYLVFCVARIIEPIIKEQDLRQVWIGFSKTRKPMNPYVWNMYSDAPKNRPYTLEDMQELFVLLKRFYLEKGLVFETSQHFEKRAANLFLTIQENKKTFDEEAITGFFLSTVFAFVYGDCDIEPLTIPEWYANLC